MSLLLTEDVKDTTTNDDHITTSGSFTAVSFFEIAVTVNIVVMVTYLIVAYCYWCYHGYCHSYYGYFKCQYGYYYLFIVVTMVTVTVVNDATIRCIRHAECIQWLGHVH